MKVSSGSGLPTLIFMAFLSRLGLFTFFHLLENRQGLLPFPLGLGLAGAALLLLSQILVRHLAEPVGLRVVEIAGEDTIDVLKHHQGGAVFTPMDLGRSAGLGDVVTQAKPSGASPAVKFLVGHVHVPLAPT